MSEIELTLLTQGEIDAASLHRILLPRLLRDMSIMPETDQTVIARILDAGGQKDLPGIVETILNPLPLNSRLREMGLARGDIKRAISDARTRFHVPSATADRLTAIVEDVY